MADGSIASAPAFDLLREEGASFADRHVGPDAAQVAAMLAVVGAPSLETLIDRTVPAALAHAFGEGLPRPLSEIDALAELRALARENVPARSLIGCGYHGTHVPPVIARNVLESPAWYTAYTPYQAEIAQGRLEALLNFQTAVASLTGLPVANASLLDEATAVAEAIAMAQAVGKKGARAVVLASDLHPQTRAVVATRAAPLRTTLADYAAGDVGALREALERTGPASCVVLQYPGTTGGVRDLAAEIEAVHEAGALAVVSADPLALVMLASPGSQGADVVVGSAQRFGVPMGFGGPHAAFFATREAFRRALPGRIVGVSVDAAGRPAMRLALQTREQHIRREKATSNICTAQVLLAVMAGFYAVWHGPEGLRAIASRVHGQATRLAASARLAGMRLRHELFFDTVTIEAGPAAGALRMRALAAGFNIRGVDGAVSIALDETVSDSELVRVIAALGLPAAPAPDGPVIGEGLARREALLTEAVFSSHRSEHEMLRYIRRLADRDVALDRSMIPLGSCTMKLNATSEMLPVSWPEFMDLHPFAPAEQTMGTRRMIARLEGWLAAATGFASVSLQPNAGSQGELAGLLAIRAFHASRGEEGRDVCLIPASAHGTNPASAAMTGMRVVVVACDRQGNIDLDDLRGKATAHADRLAALMVTYPSTHGVFEEGIGEVCRITHEAGGQVYMDGANLNAQLGLTTPASVGADVCHLNLHKTFCIPHGGGGPGVGPIAVAPHLAPFLPNHPFRDDAGPASGVGPVAAAPFGSAGILPISYAYIRMMGAVGLKRASETAILAANYVAARLRGHYEVVYLGAHGYCAHECIVDCRPFEAEAGIKVEDIAKRLQDYGFHAPTMSWPVPGTLMIEPTESETQAEMDRFCDAMIAIRGEIARVASGALDRTDNPLRNAPHTADEVTGDVWDHAYARSEAAYPLPFVRANKYWPPVKRVDNVYGDRNLVCTCAPLEAYAE